MFCPSCGAQSIEPIKFCKRCGTNLRRVKGVLSHGGGSVNHWIPEAMLAQAEIERQQGITPEVKRLNEVRDGLVTTFVGMGVMIFLYSFLGVIASMIHDPGVARLVDHIWLVGVIPFLVGVAITLNGLIISKRIVEMKHAALHGEEGVWGPETQIQAEVQEAIDAPTTSSFDSFSITESTTTHLGERVAGQPQGPPAQQGQHGQQGQQVPPGSQERSSTH